MSDAPLPQPLIDFLAQHIDSVLELEVLLLLRSDPQKRWTADTLADTLKIDARRADEYLRKFSTAAIFARSDQPVPEYFYAPSNPQLDQTIQTVADAYASHRVRVIGLIFSKPVSTLKSFADAFRIRRDNNS